MNFYRFVYFLRSRIGLAFLGGAILVLVMGLWPSGSRKAAHDSNRKTTAVQTNNSAHFTVSRLAPPMVAVSPKPELTRTNRHPTLYTIHVDPIIDTNSVVRSTAPFGRLIQCQLVNTLESLTPNTPIIALVTEDVWFKGELIIPAGTEVHGQAQLDRVRERIISTGTWKIVYQTGEQPTISGFALDREFAANGAGWGLTDGSAGIRGEIIRSHSLDEVKLFLATGLSAVASGLQETRSTPFGTYIPGTIRNAPQNAASAVLNLYAQQVLEAIKRDGLFVRVSAGKQFYVYATQDVGRPTAREGQVAFAANRQDAREKEDVCHVS